MNLYVHFPFCRAKCAYCALPSRAGSTAAARSAYVSRLAGEIVARVPPASLDTVYFGGGTPALCGLKPLLDVLRPRLAAGAEWTVELHPLDVARPLLDELLAGGVNRVSLGVQSLDDAVLRAMRRGHSAAEAEAAFRTIRAAGFGNAGLDLIAGLPGADDASWRRTLARATALAPDHCSVYALMREPRTRLDLMVRRGEWTLPDDGSVLAQMDTALAALRAAGLARYEISNAARPGFECRHNLAVWRGADYLGLGDGAHGRENRIRTVGEQGAYRTETLSEEADALERALFALRLPREGLDLASAVRRWPVLAVRAASWRSVLDALAGPGLVRPLRPGVYALTPRGLDVCDAVLAELV
ncbi:MAG: coproporphyrinogen-III oxidase family protein [Kiritimatiellia bacterium]